MISQRHRRRRHGRPHTPGRAAALAGIILMAAGGGIGLGLAGYRIINGSFPFSSEAPGSGSGGNGEADEATGRPKLPTTPEETLLSYMGLIEEGQYETMYEMLNAQSRELTPKDTFLLRNRNIYEGIEASDIQVTVTGTQANGDAAVTVFYEATMDTVAGELFLANQVDFMENDPKDGESPYPYLLIWDDSAIFPELSGSDKVRVIRDVAVRGEILDRNGAVLAGKGTAASIGIVPGKLAGAMAGDSEASAAVASIAALLELTPESIEKKLSAGWVKADSFVPVKTVKKPMDEGLKAALLEIPGVMVTDTQTRDYPLGPAASHLTGYLQQVTAEDLEKHHGEGYRNDSVIGRSGLELLYEKELRGQDGCRIVITDGGGQEKSVLAQLPRQDGQTIRLTIDAGLQQALYNAYAEDKSCSVAINPRTGEVLALVSTPSFDSRDFTLGMPQALWDSLNNDPRLPLYNRFRQKLCPGSSFKPIAAAIGLANGSIDPDTDYGSEGLKWQNDAGWGSYYVTTLHDYAPATLENALVYSDNIYFAKAALRMGSDAFMKALDNLGFNQPLPFELSLAASQYSNEGTIVSEIQLADSGYGQGEMLVNPIHLAALYTGFANGGTVLKPFLLYQDSPSPMPWLSQAYAPENADRIRADLEQAVASPHGTGHKAYREDIPLAGKTGTAEIKLSKDDTSGTELGWFCVFTARPDAAAPILLVTMAEDVKDRGGSGYVVEKSAGILGEYFAR